MFFHSKHSTPYPLFMKIDLSPVCNIRCTACIHADKLGDGGLLDKQQFHASQRMSMEHYKELIDQVRGKCLSVVLHYMGDPYMYSELDKASLYAYEAGMRVHVGSNFSYPFSDDRIESIVRSGVTDLTVCVDGLTQELYQKTRVGGNIDRVLNNLERLCKKRKELKSKRMHIEVQYIRFDHNRHQEAEAREKVLKFGVDQFSTFNGNSHNWTLSDPNSGCCQIGSPLPRQRFGLPKCHWPYTSMVIRYDGEVIPCCVYRHASQYADGIKPITFGNVFGKIGGGSVRKIWNSDAYQTLRQQIFDGSTVFENEFCYGCGYLFDVDFEKRYVINPIEGGLMVAKKNSAS